MFSKKIKLQFFSLLFLSLFVNLQFSLANIDDIDTYSKLLEDDISFKTISMDFINARLNDVLKIFSQQSGLNFIAATNVADKTVNLYLDNVPVDEALERILSANNLAYEIKPGSNIFIVKQLETPTVKRMTRVYTLKNASVSSSQINSTFSTAESGSSSSGGDSSGGILGALKKILSESGEITEDPRTNSLIITDIPAVFPAIEQTIAKIDIRVPQILIEVEMLDISKTISEEMGAKFSNSPVSFSGPKKNFLFPFSLDNAADDGHDVFSDMYTMGDLSFANLAATLQFLKTQTDTKNLARPRILTLNNQTAEIKIETDEVIGVTTSESSTGNLTSGEPERYKTGVSLRVTPQVNLVTKEIKLALEPKVTQARESLGFQGQTFKDPELRGTKSTLRVKDGNTIILGGLLRTDFSNTKTKVPFLSNVPILGNAFKHKNFADVERELVIFITPNILKDNESDLALRAQNIEREQTNPFTQDTKKEKNLLLNKITRTSKNSSDDTERSNSSNSKKTNKVNKELEKFENKRF